MLCTRPAGSQILGTKACSFIQRFSGDCSAKPAARKLAICTLRFENGPKGFLGGSDFARQLCVFVYSALPLFHNAQGGHGSVRLWFVDGRFERFWFSVPERHGSGFGS